MSFLAGLGITSEKPPIVIELGCRYTKIGFSGETGPRIIVHTPEEFENSNLDEIGEFLLWIYNIHLQISPRERRLLFVEKISDRSTFRENLTKCALNRLAVPGVIFLSLPVAAVTCAGINSNTGLVAKLGWSSMTVSPVVHGVPLIWNERQSTIGGEYVASHFKKQTLVDNPEYGDLELHLFDDIIARLGYIRGLEHIDNPPQSLIKQDETVTDIDVDGQRFIKIRRGDVLESVEHLFTKCNEDGSLPTLVLESLLEAPIDSRRALAGNIIIAGGLGRLPGLGRRLLQEIKQQITQSRYIKLANLDFIITDMPCKSNCICWLGGAIYASGESVWRNQIDLQGLKMTEERYDFENIPDWCGPPLPEPKTLPSRPSLATSSPIRRMLQISKMSK